MKARHGAWVALAIGALVSSALAGCSSATDGSKTNGPVLDASRSVVYGDLQSLLGDATGVVEGQVESTNEVDGGIAGMPATAVNFRVDRWLTPIGLGKRLGSVTDVKAEEITVLQAGTSDYSSLPAPFLKSGTSYLLFVNSSELDGDLAADFYVTGGNAGIYVTAGAGRFQRLVTDTADNIPNTITEKGING